jgi:hypothetical protein
LPLLALLVLLQMAVEMQVVTALSLIRSLPAVAMGISTVFLVEVDFQNPNSLVSSVVVASLATVHRGSFSIILLQLHCRRFLESVRLEPVFCLLVVTVLGIVQTAILYVLMRLENAFVVL